MICNVGVLNNRNVKKLTSNCCKPKADEGKLPCGGELEICYKWAAGESVALIHVHTSDYHSGIIETCHKGIRSDLMGYICVTCSK